jgi:hypothetical protein
MIIKSSVVAENNTKQIIPFEYQAYNNFYNDRRRHNAFAILDGLMISNENNVNYDAQIITRA